MNSLITQMRQLLDQFWEDYPYVSSSTRARLNDLQLKLSEYKGAPGNSNLIHYIDSELAKIGSLIGYSDRIEYSKSVDAQKE